MAETSNLAIILDADGTIYNDEYRFIYLSLIAKHSDFMRRYAKKDYLTDEDKEVIDATFSVMIHDVTHTYELPNVIHTILQNVGIEENELDEEQLETFLTKSINIHREYLRSFGEKANPLFRAILYAANEAFFREVFQSIRNNAIVKVTLISGSSRQSNELDFFNSYENGTGLFTEDLVLIKEILEEKSVNKNIVFIADPFLMASLFDGEHCVFDHSKITTYYAIFHHLAKHINQQTRVLAFDDRSDIDRGLNHFLDGCGQSMPRHFSLQQFLYDYNRSSFLRSGIINGCGPIDFNYKENTLNLFRLCGHDLKNYEKSINAAKIPYANLIKFFDNRVVNVFKPHSSESTNTFFAPKQNTPSEDQSASSSFIRKLGCQII